VHLLTECFTAIKAIATREILDGSIDSAVGRSDMPYKERVSWRYTTVPTDETHDMQCANTEYRFCSLRKMREYFRDPVRLRMHGREDQALHELNAHHGRFADGCFIADEPIADAH